jgi:hypothetical protein
MFVSPRISGFPGMHFQKLPGFDTLLCLRRVDRRRANDAICGGAWQTADH